MQPGGQIPARERQDVHASHALALANARAAAGDRDTALAALRTAMPKNIPSPVFPLDPWFVPYQDDPDFKPLFYALAHQADALYARLTAKGLTSGRRVTP